MTAIKKTENKTVKAINKKELENSNATQYLVYKDIMKFCGCARGKANKIIKEIKEKFNIERGTKITLYHFLDFYGRLNLLPQ